jgi:hypothetical protein
MLGSENDLNIKNASMCLAVIAKLEIPLGQWDEFLDIMSSNALNDNHSHRHASI